MKKLGLFFSIVFIFVVISNSQTPTTEKGWFDLGFRQREEYKFAESLDSFNECLKLNPKSTPCLGLRGKSYWNLAKYDLAKQDFDTAIQISPNSYLLYQYRGEYQYSWRSKGQVDAAIADFSKAIQLKPDYAPAYLARGESYEFNKEPILAINDVNKAIELNPNFTAAKIVLDRLKAKNPTTNQPKSTPTPQPALTEKEKAALATEYLNNAIFNFRGDKFAEAAADFTKYLNIYPDSAEGFYNRGFTYAKWGKPTLAITDLEKALKLKPDFPKAKAELDKLKQTKTEEIVTSISQITDVKPTDEFYEDLQSLIERYGISKVTKDKKFAPNKNLTMNEYADFIKQGKEYLRNSASGFGIKAIDEEKLFNPKCTLPYLEMIPEKEIAKSLSCNYRIKNFSMPGGENWVTRGKFAIYFNKAIQQASLENSINAQAESVSNDLFMKTPKTSETKDKMTEEEAREEKEVIANAEKELNACLKKSQKCYFERAFLASMKDDFPSALKQVNLALAAEPKNVRYLSFRADMYLYDLDDYQKAWNDFTTLIRLQPKSGNWYVDRAYTACKIPKLKNTAKNDEAKAVSLGSKIGSPCK